MRRTSILWMEKVRTPKEAWVTCPSCKKCFIVHKAFFTPKFAEIKLHCPWCGHEFLNEESPQIW